MNHNNFEEFLTDKFTNKYPEILDDNLIDAFNTWITELDTDTWLIYGEEWKIKSSL